MPGAEGMLAKGPEEYGSGCVENDKRMPLLIPIFMEVVTVAGRAGVGNE